MISPTRTTRRRWAPAVAVFGSLAGVVGACGDDDTKGTTPSPPGTSTAETVEVTMVDYAFEGLAHSVAAGTRLTVVNRAPTELHEVVAFRLPDDEDRSVAELAGLAPGDLVATLGEPATVLLAAPGGPQISAVGDGTLAEPGRYAIMCFIPTGADVDEYLTAAADPDREGPPRVEGGPPHFVHGMYTELTVES